MPQKTFFFKLNYLKKKILYVTLLLFDVCPSAKYQLVTTLTPFTGIGEFVKPTKYFDFLSALLILVYYVTLNFFEASQLVMESVVSISKTLNAIITLHPHISYPMLQVWWCILTCYFHVKWWLFFLKKMGTSYRYPKFFTMFPMYREIQYIM